MLALCFTSDLFSEIHHKKEIKALYVAQAGHQLPKFVRQFPGTALDTTVSSSIPFFPKLPPVFLSFSLAPDQEKYRYTESSLSV